MCSTNANFMWCDILGPELTRVKVFHTTTCSTRAETFVTALHIHLHLHVTVRSVLLYIMCNINNINVDRKIKWSLKNICEDLPELKFYDEST